MGEIKNSNSYDFDNIGNASPVSVLLSGMGNTIEAYLIFPNTGEGMLVSSRNDKATDIGKRYDFRQYFDEFMDEHVFEGDRHKLFDNINPKTIQKRIQNDGGVLEVDYRDISFGVPIWYTLRVLRVSENEFLYGYIEQNSSIISRRIFERMLDEYFALYLVDFDTDILTVIKDSPFFARGEGAIVSYKEGILDFASNLDGEEKAFMERLSDKEVVREELRREDKINFSYESAITGDGNTRWVTLTFHVLRRDDKGDVASLTISASLTDKHEIMNQELKRQFHLHTQVIDVVSSAFVLLNFVNLDTDSFMVVKEYKDELYHKLVDPSKPYSVSIKNWIENMVSPEDRDKIINASDISYLKEKFQKTNILEETIRVKCPDGYRYFEIVFARTDSFERTSEIVVYCIDRHDEIIEKLRQNEETEIVVAQRTAALKEANKSLNLLSDRVLEFIGDLVESRSEESGQHIRRVKGFTKILAQKVMEKCPEYGLTPDKVKMITHASALHDIGKIAIPDSVLLKPGRLTKEEFDLMKSHSERGAEIVMKMEDIWESDYVALARDICFYHHEKWDGKGYPKGLKGDEIPISAQIVSIADIYDALTTERCYKDAIPKKVAYRMILDGECGAFSDKLIECFKESREEFEAYSADPVEEVGSAIFSLVDDAEYSIPAHVKNREFIADTLPVLMKITEDMPTACYCYYATGDEELIFYNNNLVTVFGCESKEEFSEYVNNSFKGIVYSEDYQEVKSSIKYQIENTDNNVDHVVFHIKRKDGEIRKVDNYGHLIHSDDLGDVFFVFLIDITEYGYGDSNSEEDEEILKIEAFKNHKILLVDDDGMSRDIACEILESEGARVISAFDGRDALNKFRANENFDMVLMDVVMPVMDGIEATRRIREVPTKNNVSIPIICFTADTDEDLKRECLEAGADAFIRKPLNVLELSLKYAACMKKRTYEMQGKVRESMLLANTDSLTKVKNATAYAEKVGALNFEMLSGANVKFAIVMCDINDLKAENDTFGHDSGDIYIKNSCKIISKAFKHSPIYRIGGDEFVAVVEGEDYEKRDFIFANMIKNVEIASKYASASMGRASFAAGMAVYNPLMDRTVSDTVKRADEQMYKNKIEMKSHEK